MQVAIIADAKQKVQAYISTCKLVHLCPRNFMPLMSRAVSASNATQIFTHGQGGGMHKTSTQPLSQSTS